MTALIVGTVVSLLQTVTSIQEQTLSFVPKLLACGLCLWIMAPWMLEQLGALFEIMLTKAGTFTP
jgi:flagellar biosynthetic protein FliQ